MKGSDVTRSIKKAIHSKDKLNCKVEMPPEFPGEEPVFPKTRAFSYGYGRNNFMSSGSDGKKGKTHCFERAAGELRKSRVFWWRLTAVGLAILLLKIGSMTSKGWKIVARDEHASQVGSFMENKVSTEIATDMTGDTISTVNQGQPVDATRAFNEISLSKKVGLETEEDEDIKITKKKKEKRMAFRQVDNFCKKVMKNPIPFDKGCKRIGSNMTCVNGDVVMFSQFGQDYYLFKEHFRYLKRDGTYMDVASNDAIGISNSYFFDRCLGWRGVCIEGNPLYFERIFRLRSCTLVPTCVGKNEGETVKFGLAGGAGGIMGASNKHMKVWAEEGKEVHTIKERCTTMTSVMEREQMFNIDYLSLDVEGHEMHVLQGIDWERTKINVMTIEVSRQSGPVIEQFLLERNYKRHKATYSERNDLVGSDVVYLHEDVVWGKPV